MKETRRRLRLTLLLLILVLFANFQSWAGEPSRYKRPSAGVSHPVAPSDKVVALARFLAYDDFPTATDIVAIACIESRFIANARNGISQGIMQVNRGPWEIGANMQAGVKLLREYFLMLGSVMAAVLAYNAGPTNYKRGRFNSKYWLKFKESRSEYEIWLRRPEGIPVGDTDGGPDLPNGNDRLSPVSEYPGGVLLHGDGTGDQDGNEWADDLGDTQH